MARFLLAALIIIGAPLVVIWALNTLFSAEVEYNISTWAAALILSAALVGR